MYTSYHKLFEHFQELGISGDEFNVMLGIVSWATCGDGRSRDTRKPDGDNQHEELPIQNQESTDQLREPTNSNEEALAEQGTGERTLLTQEYREQVGRRAKQLLDWARVLYLRDRGFDARLCYFVPKAVSLENVCIVANKKLS